VGPRAGMAGTENLALIFIRSPDRSASRYTDYVMPAAKYEVQRGI